MATMSTPASSAADIVTHIVSYTDDILGAVRNARRYVEVAWDRATYEARCTAAGVEALSDGTIRRGGEDSTGWDSGFYLGQFAPATRAGWVNDPIHWEDLGDGMGTVRVLYACARWLGLRDERPAPSQPTPASLRLTACPRCGNEVTGLVSSSIHGPVCLDCYDAIESSL